MALNDGSGQPRKPVRVICPATLVGSVMESLEYHGIDGDMAYIEVTNKTVVEVTGSMRSDEDDEEEQQEDGDDGEGGNAHVDDHDDDAEPPVENKDNIGLDTVGTELEAACDLETAGIELELQNPYGQQSGPPFGLKYKDNLGLETVGIELEGEKVEVDQCRREAPLTPRPRMSASDKQLRRKRVPVDTELTDTEVRHTWKPVLDLPVWSDIDAAELPRPPEGIKCISSSNGDALDETSQHKGQELESRSDDIGVAELPRPPGGSTSNSCSSSHSSSNMSELEANLCDGQKRSNREDGNPQTECFSMMLRGMDIAAINDTNLAGFLNLLENVVHDAQDIEQQAAEVQKWMNATGTEKLREETHGGKETLAERRKHLQAAVVALTRDAQDNNAAEGTQEKVLHEARLTDCKMCAIELLDALGRVTKLVQMALKDINSVQRLNTHLQVAPLLTPVND